MITFIQMLQNYIKLEEFETDSIYMDIEGNIGNIENEVNTVMLKNLCC